MIKAIQVVLILALGATCARAQQIASVDLAHEKASSQSAKEQLGLPKGCEAPLPSVTADGVVTPSGGEPREIVVETISVSSENPVADEEMLAQVQLRNISKYSISIPWSTDPTVATVRQDPSRIDWEEGEFQIELAGSDLLQTLSKSLYGSKFVVGSLLAIQPGEWITANVKFKLALQYPIAGRSIGKGKKLLRTEWKQATRVRSVKNCAISTGWFTYRDYYRQQLRGVAITIK